MDPPEICVVSEDLFVLVLVGWDISFTLMFGLAFSKSLIKVARIPESAMGEAAQVMVTALEAELEVVLFVVELVVLLEEVVPQPANSKPDEAIAIRASGRNVWFFKKNHLPNYQILKY